MFQDVVLGLLELNLLIANQKSWICAGAHQVENDAKKTKGYKN